MNIRKYIPHSHYSELPITSTADKAQKVCLRWTVLLLMLFVSLLTNGSNTYTSTSVLSQGKWVKICVKDAGVYQLTPAKLRSMGFADPSHVRLYGYNCPVLPETNIQNIPDDLCEIPLFHAPNGNFLFYSKGITDWRRSNSTTIFEHRNNPYSSRVCYFLTEDASAAPAQFRQIDATTTSAATQTTYYAHSVIDDDAYSFLNCGRTFFEEYDYASGSSKNYNIKLEAVPMGDVSITVQFGAAGSTSSTLSIASGTATLGKLSFSRLAEYQYASVNKNTFTLSGVTTTSIPLKLTHERTSGVSGHLDYIRACYTAQLALTNSNYVAFTPNRAGSTIFGIKGTNLSNIVLWNVTSPSSTCELKGTPTTTTYNASITSGKVSDLYVALDHTALYPEPESLGTVANQNLHGLKDVNLLIIVPSSGKLTAQAQRLAEAHTRTDGMTCAVVSADKVYNEFSSGTPDVTAYRRMAKMFYDRDESLQNILLFGACYWDNRFVTTGLSKKNPDDYLLVFESVNSWSHTDSYACEEYISLLDDGEGVSPLKEKPDAGVGRIPVTTEAEATHVVNKLISYIENRETGAWKNTICMMSDDGNANTHAEDAENVLKNTQSYFPDFNYRRIYWDSYKREQSATGNSYPEAYAEINRTMQQGALIMNYTGHGAAYCLSHEQVLKTKDFQSWSSPRLPLWFTAACDVCPFDMNTENLACEALLNPNGAAMGFVSTARTVYSSPNRTINRNFMRYVLASNEAGERYTIGEALALAKCDILGTRSPSSITRLDSLNKVHYVLMGDPAIRLLTPEYKVRIDAINGVKASEKASLAAGTKATISGHIVDEDNNDVPNYHGIIFPTIYDSKQHIICYNNDKSAVKPFEYDDYTRTIYNGSDSIYSGQFTFSFIVPYDLNYNEAEGMMKLYAVNSTSTIEANGTFSNFYVGGAGDVASRDTIGPNIKVWLNTPAFRDGLHVGTTPTLYALLTDSCGINTTGGGVGHGIMAIVDNNEATSYSLNSYFSQTIGDPTSGTITYTLPPLTAGWHTLTLRAFDIFNNPGAATISFYVYEGEETVELYDMSGRRFSSDIRTTLPPGVYIRHIVCRKDGEIIQDRTEKYMVK